MTHAILLWLACFVAPSVAVRVGESSDVVCPDGHICTPAPCDVENSNGEPGLACHCGDGFDGTITWSGPVASGDCAPARCDVEHSNGEPGLACRCGDGFDGTITWSGPVASGDCTPAQCDVEHSNGEPGLACRCGDGFDGTITWLGPVASGDCTPAQCDVEHSNKLPGFACQCSDGFTGKIAWSGPQALGMCKAASCTVEGSNRKPGLQCRCEDHSQGKITWSEDKAFGSCSPAPCDIPNSNKKPGLDCMCDDFHSGAPFKWEVGKPHGECSEERDVELITLLNDKSRWFHGDKEFKCCASRGDGTLKFRIVDMKGTLPAARNFGKSDGCGRMFGDTWHGAARRERTCKMKFSAAAEALQITQEELVEFLPQQS